MPKYDFDKVIERRGTGSVKYDAGMEITGREDLLPMWVADMDLMLPDEVLQSIHARTDHGIFGYSLIGDSYYDALEKWFARRYGWTIEREWNTAVPGVVYAIACAVRAITSPGDAVLIQEPVYYPFRSMIEQNGRTCVNNELVQKDGRFMMDTREMEELIVSQDVRAMILCSPHNPVSRVWTREELVQVDEICRRHDVRVIADEIHCDFIFPGSTFTPFAALGEESLQNTIVCTAPSKTFNMAGLQVSNILIPNAKIRARFRAVHEANGCWAPNALGLTAAEAAYRYGDEWLNELLVYLQDNISYVRDYLKTYLPKLRLTEPEGTYLLWIDFSGVTEDPAELEHLIRDKAHLWLDGGAMFGNQTSLYQRINIACPRKTLEKAMEQLRSAFTVPPHA